MNKPASIDEYIAAFPAEAQTKLEQMRAAVLEIAPQAQQVISYGMPAFKLNGMLVWFGAFTNHIGFYPRVSAIAAFKSELSVYKGAKGTVQFPFGKPLPIELIKDIVKFRVVENSLHLKVKRS